MPEVHVVALIPVNPEAVEEVRSSVVELVEATMQEDGCLSYVAYTSASDPSTFVTVERWREQADLDAHFGTPHIAAAMAALDGKVAGEVSIHTLVPIT